MLYDLNCEPGHAELFNEVRHVDLSEYQPGSPHYEQLMAQLDLAQRFQQPDTFMVNL